MAATVLNMAFNQCSRRVQPLRRAYFSGCGGIAAAAAAARSACTRSPNFSGRICSSYREISTEIFEPAQSGRASGSDLHTFDVVVVGAGIIGLTIARQFLLGSNLSVALVDAAVPCAGATGAGQGYIWRVNKSPGSHKWELAVRSHGLWEALAESVRNEGLDPLQTLGWKKTGSLLVGKTSEDCADLKKSVDKLVDFGVSAVYLNRDDLLAEEPALKLGDAHGAAFVPGDFQIDAKRTVAYIEKGNRKFAAEGRYVEFYYEPVTSLLRDESSGEVVAVQTKKNMIRGKKAVIIATGCWTGSVMDQLLKDSEIDLDFPVKPRKGHLLVLDNDNTVELNHALMESGYLNHASAAGVSAASDSDATSISMTATLDPMGRLVLGSSRQLVGFDTEVDETIVQRIWDRAGDFFPALKEVSLQDMIDNRKVRVGLRPYMPGGAPKIGPVPGFPKMFVVAGHEGEGLTLALGSAEMIFDMTLGNTPRVDAEPFSM
ncbi:uncharacterized protein LOC127259023 [Andrographis paniculata]|uniref:uncharacterized protein LOC127259023 n=1 Tax=Andrographis paniculata TaxID=175694 RepID=UPI0021E74512|nr:uncharacterized protein LOC127259023 [Andrographis paniculata]